MTALIAAALALQPAKAFQVIISELRPVQPAGITAFQNRVAPGDVESAWPAAATWSVGSEAAARELSASVIRVSRTEGGAPAESGYRRSWTIAAVDGIEAKAGLAAEAEASPATPGILDRWTVLPASEGQKVRLNLVHTRFIKTGSTESKTFSIRLAPLMEPGQALLVQVKAEGAEWYYIAWLKAVL
jgi:hypothetical protein